MILTVFESLKVIGINLIQKRIKSRKNRNPLQERVSNYGRDDRIRTCDPHVPNVVRYRAALHPVIFSREAKINFLANLAKLIYRVF